MRDYVILRRPFDDQRFIDDIEEYDPKIKEIKRIPNITKDTWYTLFECTDKLNNFQNQLDKGQRKWKYHWEYLTVWEDYINRTNQVRFDI